MNHHAEPRYGWWRQCVTSWGVDTNCARPPRLPMPAQFACRTHNNSLFLFCDKSWPRTTSGPGRIYIFLITVLPLASAATHVLHQSPSSTDPRTSTANTVCVDVYARCVLPAIILFFFVKAAINFVEGAIALPLI